MTAWKGDCPECWSPGDFVSPHFTYGELCRLNDPWPPEIHDRMLRLAFLLEEVRTEMGVPLVVTSGYRSPDHNAHTAGSAKQSQHCAGRAADFRCSKHGASVDACNQWTLGAHDYLRDNADRLGVGGLGWYRSNPRQRRARVHVDLRWRPPGAPLARWVKDA